MTSTTPPSAAIAEKLAQELVAHVETGIIYEVGARNVCFVRDHFARRIKETIDSRVGPLVDALEKAAPKQGLHPASDMCAYCAQLKTRHLPSCAWVNARAALALWSQGGKEESGEVAIQVSTKGGDAECATKHALAQVSGAKIQTAPCTEFKSTVASEGAGTVQAGPSADDGTPEVNEARDFLRRNPKTSYRAAVTLFSSLAEDLERRLSAALAERDRLTKYGEGLKMAVEGYDEQLKSLRAELAKVKEELIEWKAQYKLTNL